MKVRANTLDRSAILVRDMASSDLEQVLAIERNAQVSPWARLSFEESLTKQHNCRVIESGDEVLAFHVVCTVVDELHILNVVTAKQLQGVGLGHMLMHDIVSFAREQHLRKIFLEVRASNEVAQSLYRKWQFEHISMRKGYYSRSSTAGGGVTSQREDALIYLRRLLV